jgi:iron complex transport system ATP-binding protein
MLLNASNISFSYADRPILRDVSLSFEPSQIVSLLGPNGAGKSTLIRTLLGDLHATGTIEWDGKALSSWSRRDLARRVAYLPQAPTSDPGTTVLDVLRLGRASYWSAFGIESERDVQVVDQVAASLGLRDLLNRSMDELSGGQRQRVFVGRCLVQEPAAMLLDEPSTFLDLKHQVELCDLLHSLAREKQIAILMASHDLNLAAGFSDRLILLHDGAVVATGSAAEVLQPALLQKVYGIPIERIDRPSNAPLVFPSIEPTS